MQRSTAFIIGLFVLSCILSQHDVCGLNPNDPEVLEFLSQLGAISDSGSYRSIFTDYPGRDQSYRDYDVDQEILSDFGLRKHSSKVLDTIKDVIGTIRDVLSMLLPGYHPEHEYLDT